MDDIVSYIYDEVSAAERTKFEKHLSNCSVCTDEFAAISNARFSVFEWQKEDFAHLSTPEIVIPYVPKKMVGKETASVSLLDGIRSWLSLVKFPVTVAAGLIVCVGLGFLVMTYLDKGAQQIASNVKSVPPIETQNPKAVVPTADDKNKSEATVATVPPPVVRPSRHIQSVKAAEYRRPRSERQLTASNPVNRNTAQNTSTAPVLSENYEEADDNSLRLSDLFADVDG